MSEETSYKIMERALDLGIDMIDTADTYTRGESERIIGQFVKDRREDVILATKAGKEADAARDTPPNKSSVSRANIIYRVEQSLKKLQTDYIDVFYVHKYDPEIPLEETMTTLDSLVKQGKIRYIACSNYTTEQIAESQRVAERLGLENFIAVQNQYNLLDNSMEKSVIPYCLRNGVGMIAYSPLSGGFLAGKYEHGKAPPAGSRATYKPAGWFNQYDSESNFRKLDVIRRVAAKSGLPLPIFALAWTLRENMMASAIMGASRPEQLDDAVKALDVKISPEILDELKAL